MFHPRHLQQKIRLKLLLISIALTLLSTMAVYGAFQSTIKELGQSLAANLARKQAIAEANHLSKSLNVQYSLTSTFARQPEVRRWGQQPQGAPNGDLIEIINTFQRELQGGSIFLAHSEADFYIIDQPLIEKLPEPLYRLAEDEQDDQWFYATASMQPGCYPNIDYDRGLNLTKLWLNCVVEPSLPYSTPFIVGTGLNLDQLIATTLHNEPGIQQFFIDAEGSFQLSNDTSSILQDALINQASDEQQIFKLFSTNQQSQIRQLKGDARGSNSLSVTTHNIGQEQLLAISHIPFLDWYSVVLIDLNRLTPKNLLLPLQISILFILILITFASWLIINKLLVQRIQQLADDMRLFRLEDQLPSANESGPGRDELDLLRRQFHELARDVHDRTHLLESEIKKRTRELQQLATTDELTGSANRRAIIASINFELRRASRYQTNFALMIIDLDNFKEINDQHGHLVGDRVLKEVALRCKEELRDIDLIGRLGGDEFAVLLINTDAATAEGVARRLLEKCNQMDLQHGSERIRCEASIGIAFSQPEDTEFEDLYERADKAMYGAKESGKNQIHLYQEPD